VQEELATIATLVANDARKRHVQLSLHPPDAPIHIKADGEKLRQAFLNIILNALQATPPGGRVIISTRNYETTACEISFRDTGHGIETEQLGRIFEPFFTTKTDGTGLGLAITKKIIESHGGTIAVASEVGSGTIVTVRFPL
jgi:signal transduction histidine kinase